MPTAAEIKKVDDKFKANESLPLLFADVMRASKRSDGMILIQFAAVTIGEFREQARVIMPGHSAKGMIDLLCEMSGHYPSKPENSTAPAPAKQLGK